ncbi:MAG TPA: DUF2007 domain-containing protein [Tepidisphaeraceae bacterium]
MNRLLATAPTDIIAVRTPELSEQRIVIYQTDHHVDAEALREHLIARGIACEMAGLQSTHLTGAIVRSQVYYELTVWSGDLETAKALVEMATCS